MLMHLKVWTLVLTLNYGTPTATDVVVREDLPTWADCIFAAADFLKKYPPPVAVTCQPTNLRA